jgi:hypothetical protein
VPAITSRGFPGPTLVAAVTIALLATAWSSVPLVAGSADTTSDEVTTVRVARDYGTLPVSFEPNRGQSDPQVRFLARGNGYGVFLTEHEAVLSLRGKGSSATAVRIRALAANSHPEVVGERLLPGRVNHLRGRDPLGWRTGLPSYGAVRYRGLYPGIDQLFYGSQGRLEYDYIVAPAADPGRIGLAFSGARQMTVDRSGDLLLAVAGGTVRQPRPFAYQEVGAERDVVDVRYVLDGSRVSFAIGRYDRRRPLVIDPKIEYSTYLGGAPSRVAVDDAGSAYVTGTTSSDAFPAEPGGFKTGRRGGVDVFVTKLSPDGSAVEYSTIFGGGGDEYASDIAVDQRGRAYVVGTTYSTDFPTTPGAFQQGDPNPAPAYAGADAFVTKLSSGGAHLKYSTYLGGQGNDQGLGIAVHDERAYVTGDTGSSDFPTSPGAFQPHNRGFVTAFVTKLSREGTELKYSTYLGGTVGEDRTAIAVDAQGRAYVVGTTYSDDFPTTRGAYRTSDPEPGGQDVFVTKLSSEGTRLAYSTYLGGNDYESSTGIAVDSELQAYVIGTTLATDFPTTTGAYQPVAPDPGHDSDFYGSGFVTKLSREGTALRYSTYLGGGSFDHPKAIDVDGQGRAHVTGFTFSNDFPTTADAVQPLDPGSTDVETGEDAFVARLNGDGSSLGYSTYLGGAGGGSVGTGIAVGKSGRFYVTGVTGSPEFPTTPQALHPDFAATWSAGFVTAFGP